MTIKTISFRNIVAALPHASAINPRPNQQRGSLKTKRDDSLSAERLPKPSWIRVKTAASSGRLSDIKDVVRTNQLITVYEEASCPNIGECWSKGTVTFMIMGILIIAAIAYAFYLLMRSLERKLVTWKGRA